MLRGLYNRAVVAASWRTRCLHSHDHLLAVQTLKLGSADEHSRIVCALQRRAAQKATDTLSVAWLRGGFGRGAGASSAGFRDQIDRLDDVYADEGPSGVPPSVHERSHGNAHAHLLRIAWQVGGSLQTLFHESIPSMRMLSH